jgi:hypothetical protein
MSVFQQYIAGAVQILHLHRSLARRPTATPKGKSGAKNTHLQSRLTAKAITRPMQVVPSFTGMILLARRWQYAGIVWLASWPSPETKCDSVTLRDR